MPSKPSDLPSLELATSRSKTMTNPASQSADALKPEPSPSTLSPRSPKSSPTSPLSFPKGATIRPVARRSKTETSLASSPQAGEEPPTPGFTAIPPCPSSPTKESTLSSAHKHAREASRSFFANLRASRSSHKVSTSDSSADIPPKSQGSIRERPATMGRANSSSPDLLDSSSSRLGKDDASEDQSERKSSPDTEQSSSSNNNASASKKSKPRFASLLTRTRSIRTDDSPRLLNARRASNAGLLRVSETDEVEEPLRTAPLRQDRGFKEAAESPSSTDRSNQRSDQQLPQRPATSQRERRHGASMVTSASLSQVSGASAALFNNLRGASSEAADRLGKAGRGLFGKITRSGSTNERDTSSLDDNYVFQVINLPLIEQTRKTRIAKRLEDCKDKTEFWMPALAYRCIDYLNFKGCEEEGLYRVPGSGKEVRHWQRRFDQELDINLFDEPDLYDINIIGSMFKAWLRELPDELLPKSTQQMIAEKCEGATSAPQLLRDELSKLPPYNYYLLFAITCHLNLLHSYVEQNKMDYRNLCICFQPCMKIDSFCFQFLVCDWKNCWQGCWTEKEWLEKEREAERAEREAREREANKTNGTIHPAADERAVTSGSSESEDTGSFANSSHKNRSEEAFSMKSSKSAKSSKDKERDRKSRPPPLMKSKSNPKSDSGSNNSNNNSTSSSNHNRTISQLPELGPPLSPIKI